HALAGRQLRRGEEAGDAVRHRQQRFAINASLEPEAEQVRLVLAEEVVNVDVITNDFAGVGQAAVERHLGVEQAVDGEAARLEVDAEVAGQEQVGLAGLDGDAGGDAAAVEVPGAGPNVVLGDDAAGGQRPRLARDGEDAVNEHQRLVGQADAR